MKQQISMTALVSLFARAYHYNNEEACVYSDPLAGKLLTETEYDEISSSMQQGAAFFLPDFQGTPAEALARIVNGHLAPAPLGRAAFCLDKLRLELNLGVAQYLALGAGYDTLSCQSQKGLEKLTFFEVDRPAMLADKQRRLQRAEVLIPEKLHFVPGDLADPQLFAALRQAGFDEKQKTFCSLLGTVYYLSRDCFQTLLQSMGTLLPCGSALVFDYPDAEYGRGSRSEKQRSLAFGAGEPMEAGYSCAEMEALLAAGGFGLYERLSPREISERYFSVYNRLHPGNPILPMDYVNYCLAVKQ